MILKEYYIKDYTNLGKINTCKDISYHGQKNNITKMAIIYNLICKFSEISVKIPQVDKLLLKFIWTQNSQKNVDKGRTNWRTQLLQL